MFVLHLSFKSRITIAPSCIFTNADITYLWHFLRQLYFASTQINCPWIYVSQHKNMKYFTYYHKVSVYRYSSDSRQRSARVVGTKIYRALWLKREGWDMYSQWHCIFRLINDDGRMTTPSRSLRCKNWLLHVTLRYVM